MHDILHDILNIVACTSNQLPQWLHSALLCSSTTPHPAQFMFQMLPRCVAADPISCVVVASPQPTVPPTITANEWIPAVGSLSYEFGQQLPSGVRVPAPADALLSSFTFALFALPPGQSTVYVCIRHVAG